MRPVGWMSLFFLFLSISAGVVYTPVTKVDLQDGSISDAKIYIALYDGQPLKEIQKPYRYRLLVPLLARLVPAPPPILFKGFEIDAIKVAKYKFGCINTLALASASWFLFFFCMRIGFDRAWSLIGSLLFLSSFYILNYAGLPLVDAVSYFFLITCLWALMENRNFAYFILFTIGVFAKETITLALLYILFRETSRSQKLSQFAFSVPGLILYLILRYLILPTDVGYNYTLERTVQTLANFGTGIFPWIFGVINLFFAFGFLWIWAFKGLQIVKRDANREMLALIPLLPAAFFIPFLIGSDLGRIWFLGFPAMIPLTLYGIRHYVTDEDSVKSH